VTPPGTPLETPAKTAPTCSWPCIPGTQKPRVWQPWSGCWTLRSNFPRAASGRARGSPPQRQRWTPSSDGQGEVPAVHPRWLQQGGAGAERRAVPGAHQAGQDETRPDSPAGFLPTGASSLLPLGKRLSHEGFPLPTAGSFGEGFGGDSHGH
jgi:hypothetical protein